MKYHVIVEARLDVEAESEDDAKLAALKLVGVDHCIAWETDEDAGIITPAGY